MQTKWNLSLSYESDKPRSRRWIEITLAILGILATVVLGLLTLGVPSNLLERE